MTWSGVTSVGWYLAHEGEKFSKACLLAAPGGLRDRLVDEAIDQARVESLGLVAFAPLSISVRSSGRKPFDRLRRFQAA
jgi:hypothetical protein